MATNFAFIVPSFNNKDWVERNIRSIKDQTLKDWRVIYVDDASTDGTLDLAKKAAGDDKRFDFLCSESNLGPAASRHLACQTTDDEEILCMLDGDDWLPNPGVLEVVRKLYDEGAEATWGSYQRFVDRRLQAVPVLPRESARGWFCRHLRTMRARLIKDIPLDHLQMDGKWIRCCSDVAESGWVERKVQPAIIRSSTYVYNADNSVRYPTSQYRRYEMQEYKKKVEGYVRATAWGWAGLGDSGGETGELPARQSSNH
jgi:glycosyltransferase involved in cell wall biosynthesis